MKDKKKIFVCLIIILIVLFLFVEINRKDTSNQTIKEVTNEESR
jgi:uncharacterized alpha/beta hydrolase family protein